MPPNHVKVRDFHLTAYLTVGKNIEGRRRAMGLSVEEAAARLERAARGWRAWETGRRPLSLGCLELIARALETSVHELTAGV